MDLPNSLASELGDRHNCERNSELAQLATTLRGT